MIIHVHAGIIQYKKAIIKRRKSPCFVNFSYAGSYLTPQFFVKETVYASLKGTTPLIRNDLWIVEHPGFSSSVVYLIFTQYLAVEGILTL